MWEVSGEGRRERRGENGEAATTGWYKIRWDDSAIYVAGQITDATKEDYNDQIKFLFSFDGVPAGETALDFSYVPKAGVYSWTSVGYNPNGNSLTRLLEHGKISLNSRIFVSLFPTITKEDES